MYILFVNTFILIRMGSKKGNKACIVNVSMFGGKKGTRHFCMLLVF
jgi:hypothetical protein